VKSIFITGAGGFVGGNIINFFKSEFTFTKYQKEEHLEIKDDIVFHFAGKAHDLKNVSNFEDYYIVNTELTKKIFDCFLESEAKVFITLSSVKAVADDLDCELTEDYTPNPKTHYGKSKLLAEKYILSKNIPLGKRVFILRPCMIHGTGNKGNLNLLYKIVSKQIPWPLGAYDNKRSFCSIDNLCFIINELITREDIPTGIYNISDDVALSTNEIIRLISETISKKIIILKIPKQFIYACAQFGDMTNFIFNTDKLRKLTSSFIVSNKKIKSFLSSELPISSKNGFTKTFKSFKRDI
jgi:nucleoside-diphosphate-sugar epimerase